MIRRGAGQLRSLDLASTSGVYNVQQLLDDAAAEGLTSQLQSLSVTNGLVIDSVGAARRLLAACPALTSASIIVLGDWVKATSVLRTLRTGGGSCCILRIFPFNELSASDSSQSSDDGPKTEVTKEGEFVAFTTQLSEALAVCRVRTLNITAHTNWRGAEEIFSLATMLRAASDAAAADRRAAFHLAATLAHPTHGPHAIVAADNTEFRSTPLLAHLCRALTAESPLRTLTLEDLADDRDEGDEMPVPAAGLEQLAAALAPGRSRLEVLELHHFDFGAATGCGHHRRTQCRLLVSLCPLVMPCVQPPGCDTD